MPDRTDNEAMALLREMNDKFLDAITAVNDNYSKQLIRHDDMLKSDVEKMSTRMIWFHLAVVVLIVASLVFNHLHGQTTGAEEYKAFQIASRQAEETEFILEKAIREIELSRAENQENKDRISLLKKEVLILKFNIEKLETSLYGELPE